MYQKKYVIINVFRNEIISILFLVIYYFFFSFNLQIYLSNLNNFFINQKICANSIILKNLLIPKIFSWLNNKKYAYYLIPKKFVNKQKYLVYFLECTRCSMAS